MIGVIRSRGLDALKHLVHASNIGEQHAFKTGPDASLCQEWHEALVDFDHAAHIVKLGGPTQVVQVVQI